MPKVLHRLLQRQIHKIYGQDVPKDVSFKELIEKIDRTYQEFDKAEKFAFHTLKVSSKEFAEVNNELIKHKDNLESIVSERTKELEQTIRILEDTKQKLIKANNAKSLFLANMSHEVRTPLNAILGFSELLMANKASFSDENQDFISKIYTGATNLTSLLNSILELTAIEAGRVEISPEKVDIQDLIQKSFDFYSLQIDSSTSIELHFLNTLPKFISIDKTKLNQIIANLISNAIKFGKGGKIRLNISHKENNLFISIWDNGVGIPEHRINAIFNSFEQADNSIKRNFGGTGLGLSITKSLVELMMGKISVSSKPNTGTHFEVQLPITPVEIEEKIDLLEVDSFHIETSSPNFFILVVEDNEMNQALIKQFFKRMGFEFKILENGLEAINFLSTQKPSLILMDLHMPVMDGFEATEIIREKYSKEELPIVAISADAFVEQKWQTMKSGFNDYITKPIDIKLLRKILFQYSNS